MDELLRKVNAKIEFKRDPVEKFVSYSSIEQIKAYCAKNKINYEKFMPYWLDSL